VSTFLALLPSGEALEALRALPRPKVEGLRWEPERRLHVTVRYTQHADQLTQDALAEVADEVAVLLAPPTILLGPLVERLGRDGTAVLPARGAEDLARAVDDALGGFLGERDHPFRGHLTIARLRRAIDLPPPVLELGLTASFAAGELYLIESNPGPQGSVYDVLHRVRFTGAPR